MTTFTNAITDAAQRELADVIQRLSKHYGFNYIEAMRMLGDDASPVKQGTPFKSMKQTTPEPVKQATPEPVKQATPEPVKQATTEPVKQTTPEPVKQATPEPVKQATPEPVKDPVQPKKKRKQSKKKEPVPDLQKAMEFVEENAVELGLKPDPELTKETMPSPEPTKAKAKYVKPLHAMPWTGKVVETWCQGLRPNGGMLSQCIMAPKCDGLCPTCFKQMKNDGKTKCGTVQDRIAADQAGKDYKNPETGKTAVSFGVFIGKQKIQRDDAIAEAAKFGIEIPESHFEVPQKRKGRPPSEKPMTKGEMALNDAIKKAVAAVTSSSESEGDMEPTTSQMLSSPIKPAAAAPIETTSFSKPEPQSVYDAETEDEEEDAIDVTIFVHNDKKYLRDKNTNMIYDETTQDLIGVYDEEKDIIQPCEEVATDNEDEH